MHNIEELDTKLGHPNVFKVSEILQQNFQEEGSFGVNANCAFLGPFTLGNQ